MSARARCCASSDLLRIIVPVGDFGMVSINSNCRIILYGSAFRATSAGQVDAITVGPTFRVARPCRAGIRVSWVHARQLLGMSSVYKFLRSGGSRSRWNVRYHTECPVAQGDSSIGQPGPKRIRHNVQLD
jgi:hypothetical protein